MTFILYICSVLSEKIVVFFCSNDDYELAIDIPRFGGILAHLRLYVL